MRVLVVGTGGVGSAFASIARRRSFFEHCALADYDLARPEAVVADLEDDRFTAHRVDASLEAGAWRGTGVLGPEAFPAEPFLAKLDEYGSPHGVLELAPAR